MLTSSSLGSPGLPPGVTRGVDLPTDVPFPQHILDFAAANRPDVGFPPFTLRETGYFEADWGEHTIPTESRMRRIREAGAVQTMTSSFPGGTAGQNGSGITTSSTTTLGDTIYIDMSSWIDPDPSLWIYFGSFTHSSEPIAYQNVIGYTFVDQSPWGIDGRRHVQWLGCERKFGVPILHAWWRDVRAGRRSLRDEPDVRGVWDDLCLVDQLLRHIERRA